MKKLTSLQVWKRSSRLSVDVYRLTSDCRNWGFRDQITRSALSIPSNIAEGYERDNYREIIRYLVIAKGSCGELWTQVHIGIEAGFVPHTDGKKVAQEIEELSKMIYGLIRHYRRRVSRP